MKGSTIIGVVVIAAVALVAYLLLGKGTSVSPSLSTPQMASQGSYPSAASSASGAGSLSVSETYNYAPSTISESTHTYQTTITPVTKVGLFNA